jgi:small-conductance mechanosensitive channel
MVFWSLQTFVDPASPLRTFTPTIGLSTLIWASIVFVKSCRILAFEYLFLLNMRAGVPLLLVNLLSLLLSVVLGGWILKSVFEFDLEPILATSAIFSVVLGLALQDTLGNLFAGVALQLDKPYELGDWVEVANGSQKWIGQVQEISWRATNLIAFTDEIITIPNRVMAQAEISNFSGKMRPFIRGHVFRIPFGFPAQQVRDTLLSALDSITSIRRDPAPVAFILDHTDSWVTFKLVYYIDDFGAQYRIGDQVIAAAMERLAEAGIPLASQRMAVSLPVPASSAATNG